MVVFGTLAMTFGTVPATAPLALSALWAGTRSELRRRRRWPTLSIATAAGRQRGAGSWSTVTGGQRGRVDSRWSWRAAARDPELIHRHHHPRLQPPRRPRQLVVSNHTRHGIRRITVGGGRRGCVRCRRRRGVLRRPGRAGPAEDGGFGHQRRSAGLARAGRNDRHVPIPGE